MPRITCPFCIREYDTSQVLYVCQRCGKNAVPTFWESKPIKCKQPVCGGFATVRKCPSCGEIIPQTALETPNLPFSIVGVSNSGKTNYITVMLHELRHSAGLHLGLSYLTESTRVHQRENEKLIYEAHTRPQSTAAGFSTPQIWAIRNLSRRYENIVPTYTFTIFDGAGEDHTRLDPNSTVCRYINASKAIILTIDPLVLSNIRHGGVVDPEVMFNSLAGSEGETQDAADIINSVALYIKAARGIPANHILDIPVAVVLTKFDTILSHPKFGPQALIKKPSLVIYENRVNMTEIRQVDGEIRNWLKAIGENAFIDAVSASFQEFYFFGVSSYGKPPKDVSHLENDIHPHRVLDPILWLFKKAQFID